MEGGDINLSHNIMLLPLYRSHENESDETHGPSTSPMHASNLVAFLEIIKQVTTHPNGLLEKLNDTTLPCTDIT